MFMQDEEILARCETCGYISQQSNVLNHVREQHSFDTLENSDAQYFDHSGMRNFYLLEYICLTD